MNTAFSEKTPIFNIPGIMLGYIGILIGIHITRTMLMNAEGDLWSLLTFAFIPARYSIVSGSVFSHLEAIWSPVSYSFLHGDWSHVIINSIWLLAFGSVVAKRFGTLRFVIFCAVGAVLGALMHYVFHANSIVPMVGASAVVSACMGAAVRFAFPKNGRFSPAVHHLPAQSLRECLSSRQVIVFTVVWFAINLIFGLGGEMFTAAGQSIAWEAHVGGFLAGLLLFAYFDPANASRINSEI